jgi:hypothetical protein
VRAPHGVTVAVVNALAAGLAVVSEMITFDAAGKALISSSVSWRPASFAARCWRVRKPTWVLRGNATLTAQQVPDDIEARYLNEEAVSVRHGRSIADGFLDWGSTTSQRTVAIKATTTPTSTSTRRSNMTSESMGYEIKHLYAGIEYDYRSGTASRTFQFHQGPEHCQPAAQISVLIHRYDLRDAVA